MDRRYVELIAQNINVTFPKLYRRLSIIGVVILSLSFLVLIAKYMPIAMGTFIFGGGLCIASFVGQIIFKRKKTREFLKAYDECGSLPAWEDWNEESQSNS